MTEVALLMKLKEDKITLIKEYSNKINLLNIDIKSLNRKIYDNCNHNWVRDWACSDDDLSKRYCSICNLRQLNIYK